MGRSSPAAGILVALLHPPLRTSRSVEQLLVPVVQLLVPVVQLLVPVVQLLVPVVQLPAAQLGLHPAQRMSAPS